MSMVRRLAEEVRRSSERRMTPDPLQPYEIGDFGRVRNGQLNKRGNVNRWLAAKGFSLQLTPKPSSITGSSRFASVGTSQSYIDLGGSVSAGTVGSATLGFQIEFSGRSQYYFHVPGVTFIGTEEHYKVGEKLVELAKLDDDDNKFWEDDFCIVTGVYEVQSMVRVLSSSESSKVAFTVGGAAEVSDLYTIGANFSVMDKHTKDVALVETFAAPEGARCCAFYQLHKVHWSEIPKRKWWGVTTDVNP